MYIYLYNHRVKLSTLLFGTLIVPALHSCSKDDKESIPADTYLASGSWKIDSVKFEFDTLADFSDYVFVFTADGKVTAADNVSGTVTEGSWKTDLDNANKYILILDFPDAHYLAKLNSRWGMSSVSSSKMTLHSGIIYPALVLLVKIE